MPIEFTPATTLDTPIDLRDPGQLAAWCGFLGVDSAALSALLGCLGPDVSVKALLMRGASDR